MSIKTGLEYVGAIDPWTDEERLTDEKIVRCKDCRFKKTCDVLHQMRMQYGNESADNGFCAWSEREEK